MTEDKSGRLSRLGFSLGIFATVALIAGVHVLSPPEQQRVVIYVDSKIDDFNSVLKRIAAMRDHVGSTPFGGGRQNDPALAQRIADFGPLQPRYSSPDGSPVGFANVLLLRQSELRRIKAGTDPDDVASDLKYEDLSVFDEMELSYRSYIEDVASVAYERPYKGFTTEGEARSMATRLERLDTVIIYRIGSVTKPLQLAEGFVPGYMPADAFVFDLDRGDLISSFSFASTSSTSIGPKSFQRDADWYLRKDLSDNLEIVFWSHLKERMPKAVFQHEVKNAPFTALNLAQARLRSEQR